MTKKKVLFILHVPPPVHGSSVVGKTIKESSHINNVITAKYINLGTSRSLEEIGKNPIQKIGTYLSILFKTFYNLLFFRPNLVYIAITVTGKGFYKDAVVALMAKAFGKKMVYHLHNKGINHENMGSFRNSVFKRVFNNADVILLSKNLYPEIEKYVPLNRVHLCVNGVPDIQTKITTPDNKVQNGKTEILFLSNLMKAKGVYVLLEACKILKSKNVPFTCTFIGGESDITESDFSEKARKLGLNDHIYYAGRKYGIEKETAFSRAQIFAFPTLNETFGLVILEAMQFSLPVVSTIEGGIPDVVEDTVTGFLVNKNDPKAFAEKLETLIMNPELRRKMGENGKIRFENHFTIKKFEQCFSDIINKIISEKY